MSGEGGMVGRLIKTTGGVWQNRPPLTESPSGDGIALPVRWGRLVFAGFARIGRVVLSGKGGMVAYVLN